MSTDRNPPTLPLPLEITGLGSQGDGITIEGDEVRHVPDALPGERVQRDAAGRLLRIGPPGPERRLQPLCPHFPACGGCAVQHMSDALYKRWKGGLLAETLAQRGIAVVPEAMRTVPLASRRRAAFTGRWQGGRLALGFHGGGSHAVEAISACAVLRPAIVAALPAIGRIAERWCRKQDEVRVAVLAADNGLDVALTTTGGRAVSAAASDVASLARSARVLRLTVDGEPHFQSALPQVTIAGAAVTPPPGAFLQATAETDAMLAALILPALGKARRVADLFAGLGTVSLAVARQARVLAADSDGALLSALSAAHRHTQGMKPLETLRRDLFRDPMSRRELEAFDAVVLDPPRAGARAQAEVLAGARVTRVVMVSCNPATLARDLRILLDGGYALERVAPIDQFLFTSHLEAVAVLRRG